MVEDQSRFEPNKCTGKEKDRSEKKKERKPKEMHNVNGM